MPIVEELAGFAKRKLGILWRLIELGNGALVSLLHGKKLGAAKRLAEGTAGGGAGTAVSMRALGPADADALAVFLAGFDEGDRKFFSPFRFDRRSVGRLLRGGGFLFFGAFAGDALCGVFFLRLFFTGRAFLGFAAGRERRGSGLGSAMVESLKRASSAMGFRLFSTVHPDNRASMRVHEKCGFVPRHVLSSGYVLLEFPIKRTR